MLWVLRDGRDPDRFLANFEQWLRTLRAIRSDLHGTRAFAQLMQYVMGVISAEARDLVRGKVIEYIPEVEADMITWAESIRIEGRAEGRNEGRNEGRAEIVRVLLEHRFGALDATVVARLAATDADGLDLIALRVLEAADIDAVFAPRAS